MKRLLMDSNQRKAHRSEEIMILGVSPKEQALSFHSGADAPNSYAVSTLHESCVASVKYPPATDLAEQQKEQQSIFEWIQSVPRDSRFVSGPHIRRRSAPAVREAVKQNMQCPPLEQQDSIRPPVQRVIFPACAEGRTQQSAVVPPFIIRRRTNVQPTVPEMLEQRAVKRHPHKAKGAWKHTKSCAGFNIKKEPRT